MSLKMRKNKTDLYGALVSCRPPSSCWADYRKGQHRWVCSFGWTSFLEGSFPQYSACQHEKSFLGEECYGISTCSLQTLFSEQFLILTLLCSWDPSNLILSDVNSLQNAYSLFCYSQRGLWAPGGSVGLTFLEQCPSFGLLSVSLTPTIKVTHCLNSCTSLGSTANSC